MHVFKVWAPSAKAVSVKTKERLYTMQLAAGGWWQAEVKDAHAGMDYSFLIDAAEPAVPDPRSAWQPHGVHGPSRIVDHAAFAWTDAN